MRKAPSGEKLLLEHISKLAKELQTAARGLSVGKYIKLIRRQLRMSQQVLAKRAHVPQPTISRLEREGSEPTLSTLAKIFEALSCELVIAPVFKEPIDGILQKQAKKVAEKHVAYLKGTMNLERQEPDNQLIAELIKRKQDELLHSTNVQLWEE